MSDAGRVGHEALYRADRLASSYSLVLRETWYMIRSCSFPAPDQHA